MNITALNANALNEAMPAVLDQLASTATARATRALRADRFFLMRETDNAIIISDMNLAHHDPRGLVDMKIEPAELNKQLVAAMYVAMERRTTFDRTTDISDFDINKSDGFTDFYDTYLERNTVAQLWILTELLYGSAQSWSQRDALENAINRLLAACDLPAMNSPQWDTLTNN